MRATLTTTAVGLLVATALAFAAQPRPASATLPLGEYVTTLDALASAVEHLDEQHAAAASDVLRRVPGEWQVTSGAEAWTISAVWLRSDLDGWLRKPDAATRARILLRLRVARSQAASFESPPADHSTARGAVTDILSRPEFRDTAGPTWLDRVTERVLRWLARLLEAAIGSSALPTVTNIFVYALIGIAVLLVALWMYRALQRGAVRDETLLDLHTAPPRPWSEWIAEARAASGAGDWRQAVRLAYWCGIVFLEAQGAWRPDASRTPREYLRVLPPSSAHEPALRSLTALLERVWYGAGAADAASFDQALTHLRTLGCRLP